MEELYSKAYELYKEFKKELPSRWYNKEDYFNHSDELQFEAYCDGWLSYGLKYITEFDNVILLICRYGGGECGAYSITPEPEKEIRYAIETWLNEFEINEDSINFEFIHLDD